MDRHSCSLICPNGSHDPIDLPHGECVTIGRSALTRITDIQVSRGHVELTADCDKKEVRVKATGAQPCEVEGKLLSKGEMALLRHSGSLHLLPGKYENIVKFTSGQKMLGKRGADEIAEETSPSRVKRKATVSTKTKQAKLNFEKIKPPADDKVSLDKMSAMEDGDSDSEHMKEVAERLEALRRNAAASAKSEETEKESPSSSSSALQTASRIPCDVKPEPAQNSVWEEHGQLLMYTRKGVVPSSKIASYDIDGTIITTQSGKVFPTSSSDWKILLPDIPGKLKQLSSSGYKIVFFSNQMGFQKGRIKPKEFKTKIENIIDKLGVPVQVYIAMGSGQYRKPALGMWTHLVEQANHGLPVDLGLSFFVGDAAGRPKDWMPGKKKDFSCSDRMFAINIGVKFFTPEEHFLGEKPAKFEMPAFDPRTLDTKIPLLDPTSAKLTTDGPEVILFVGFPASGKSHFVRKHLIPKGYIQVNRDVLGTWQKCVQATQEALDRGKSVAVDNTSPDTETRKRYIDVAKAAGISCRCFIMKTSFDHALHNERFRELTDRSHQLISAMVFNSYKSKYQEPKMGEGFQEIVRVNFIPDFESSEQEMLYRKFLVEK